MREVINDAWFINKIRALEQLVADLTVRLESLEGGVSTSQTRLDAVLSQTQ